MYGNANDAYLESRVLTADPLALVVMLYQGAATAIREARAHLESGDIPARTAALNKACAILAELTASLDHSKGGELSQRLASLYEYMQWKLVEANSKQSADLMTEVLGLLATLEEGWAGIENGGADVSAPAPAEPKPEPSFAAQADNPFAGSPWGPPADSGCSSPSSGYSSSWLPDSPSGSQTPEPAPAYAAWDSAVAPEPAYAHSSWNQPAPAESEYAEARAWNF